MLKIFSITAALIASLISGPAIASSSVPQTPQAHNDLIQSILSLGIKVQLDAQRCRDLQGLQGFYSSEERILVLCNEGSHRMTLDNMDTLRHEALHIAQDCTAGDIGDGYLGLVMIPGRAAALASIYGVNLDEITKNYTNLGVNPRTISLEHEAWTAAASMPAETIQQALEAFCSK